MEWNERDCRVQDNETMTAPEIVSERPALLEEFRHTHPFWEQGKEQQAQAAIMTIKKRSTPLWNRSITVSSEKFITGDAFIKGYCLGPNVQAGGRQNKKRARSE